MGIPSKGRMLKETLEFMANCGLNVKRNGREYLGSIDQFPEISVVFLRQEDIITGVKSGVLTMGIAGLDLISEVGEEVDVIHDALGFGECTLEVAVPESWNVSDLMQLESCRRYRVATKFPRLTSEFLKKAGLTFDLVESAGSLEVSPAIGQSDFIVDLVSTGKTLEDNRLQKLSGGCILNSQAALITNKSYLTNERTSLVVRTLLEYVEGAIRAKKFVSVHANIRGDPESVVSALMADDGLGLQGPTISPIGGQSNWFAIHVVVERRELTATMRWLRRNGGSGIVVLPITYLFEEESPRVRKIMQWRDIL